MANTRKDIPAVNGNFKPSMADISHMLDYLAETEDKSLKVLHDRACENLWGLIDCYKEFIRRINK